eukprot:SAG11_NODE_22466_length_405_cov_2.696078_1_plen_56_part_01
MSSQIVMDEMECKERGKRQKATAGEAAVELADDLVHELIADINAELGRLVCTRHVP